jgi:tRNA(Ile)-lysidine synthase
MNHLLDRVRRTVREQRLAAADTRVLVALSGGPDSVALAHLLLALEGAGELQVAGLAHYNHRLRAAAADDEAFCAALAGRLDKPLRVEGGDVAGRARAERRSLEAAARASRHEFLERARASLGADVIALGHTRDDQAETFLLRLLRGAGARGLGGMHPRRGRLIRPLLDCRRSEVLAFLDGAGLAYRSDESNADVSIPRNRVRLELLPLLERRFNPAIVDVLASEAAMARDEWDWLAQAGGELAARAVRRDGLTWRLDVSGLSAAHPALQRQVVCQVLAEAAGARPVSFAHVEAVLALARAGGPAVDGPGLRMERRGPEVVLTSRPADSRGRPVRSSSPNFSPVALSIPGEASGADGAWTLSAEVAGGGGRPVEERRAVTGSGAVALVRFDRLTPPLAVRGRRPGDRFAPAGAIGRKKLQDYFVDRKVPRDRRDAVPIVVDAAGRIVWVAGYAIDREFAVTDPAQAVVILRLKDLGGPG